MFKKFTLENIQCWPKGLQWGVIIGVAFFSIVLGFCLLIKPNMEQYYAFLDEKKHLKEDLHTKKHQATKITIYQDQLHKMHKQFNPILKQSSLQQDRDGLISLHFQQTPIEKVLHEFAESTGLNLVISDKVKGNITLHFDNIPYQKALDIILKTNGLGKRQMDNVIVVAKSSELLQQEKEALQAQQELVNLEPLTTKMMQINYAKAMDIANLLKDKENPLLSNRGTLNVDTRTNALWIQDTEARLKEIKQLIAYLDTPVRQVLIEARIVNISREALQDLGIHWEMATSSTQNPILKNNPLGRFHMDVISPIAHLSAASFALAKLEKGLLLDLELSALESQDKAKIIASPRLMTTNQQSAVIESGEEIPYQETTISGATAVSFKKAVLSLKVTPQITPDNKLLIELQINQDSPSGRSVNGVPAILTKEVQTNILVNNGQTVVLGGIYKQEKNKTRNRVPFLGELPIVGRLFQSQRTRIKNEELLIFITPRIIRNVVS